MQDKHLFLRSIDKANAESKVAIRPSYKWDRVAAFVVDLIFVYIVGNLFSAPIKRKLEESVLFDADGASVLYATLIFLTFAIIFLIYHSFGVYFFKKTIGKRLFQIEVKSIWEDRKIDFKTSFFRAFFKGVSCLCLGIPFLALFYDKNRRVFHEKFTETYTLSQKRFSPEPTRVEVLWVHIIYAVVLAQVSMFVMFQVKDAQDKYATVSEMLTYPEYLCDAVTEAKDSWVIQSETDREPTRLEIGLTLFNANLIDGDCLSLEAQRALSFEEELDKAYLALGLVHQGYADLSNNYIEKVCEYDVNGEPCLLIQLMDSFVSENYELSHNILSKWKGPMSPYAEVVAVRQSYFEKNYAQTQKHIENLWEDIPLKKFLSLYRTLTHYETMSYEKAQEAFILTYPDLNYDQQKVLSALVCEKEIENACNVKVSKSCQKMEDNIVASELGELSDKEFVTYLKYSSCPSQNLDDVIDVLGAKVETSEQVAMIAAFKAEKQGKYAVEREFLEQIVDDSKVDTEMAHEARLMLIKRTYDVAKLKEYFTTWERLHPFHPQYLSYGLSLLNQFVEIKNFDLAAQVGEFLQMSYQNNAQLNTALHQFNKSKNNIQIATSQKSKSEFRNPASVEDSHKPVEKVSKKNKGSKP